uniref:CCHC-type domain-containing protein n=1 Tax=Sander lucioperca TaxID=283035 RepID=A0A8C9WUR8_SANLU
MSTLQDSGEKPSIYLHRLQVALSVTIKRGGISPEKADQHLLKQFCRGCWDNSLIADLQLEQKKMNPPSFAELLLLLRTEEDKCTAKATRMKQHLGASKQRVLSHSQRAWMSSESEPDVETTETTPSQEQRKSSSAISQPRTTTSKTQRGKPKPWYCFTCGEDGHIASACDNEPNSVLVTTKRKQLKEKQRLWESQNPSADQSPHMAFIQTNGL